MVSGINKVVLNVGSGFVVSLVGTLPLGYLNLLALQIYISQNLLSTIYFALGIVTIEVIAVRLTLLGAVWLLSKKRLLLYLQLFSVAFMLAFAFYFFTAKTSAAGANMPAINTALHPFVLGLVANSLNFMQYPFWAGWNIYLINSNKLFPQRPYYYWYLASTMAGTFIGMMLFVFTANYLLSFNTHYTSLWINVLFGTLFLLLALLQLRKLYKNRRRQATA